MRDALSREWRPTLAIAGPVMLGYLGIPLDESLDGDGFLRTADGGYVDGEGRLFWEVRLNDIIKTGGANVSPLEIDEVIRATGLPASAVSVGLFSLEMKKLVRQLPGKMFLRSGARE
jgi:long-subunit acyl-CoA synthetase (AMP-forming)